MDRGRMPGVHLECGLDAFCDGRRNPQHGLHQGLKQGQTVNERPKSAPIYGPNWDNHHRVGNRDPAVSVLLVPALLA